MFRAGDNPRTDDIGHQYSERVGHNSNSGSQGALIVGKPRTGDFCWQKHDEGVGDGGYGLTSDTDRKAKGYGQEGAKEIEFLGTKKNILFTQLQKKDFLGQKRYVICPLHSGVARILVRGPVGELIKS